MTEPNIIVLGAGGFVGSRIAATLRSSFPSVSGLKRAHFDMGKPATYANFDFSNSILIDCIAQIDGNSNDLIKNNFEHLRAFVDFLCSKAPPSTYLYVSTTAADGPPSQNAYVRSKQLAENYLQRVLPMSKILRLSFPFGKGEQRRRLVSRLILRIKSGEKLSIDNVTLNLTPMPFLTEHLEEIIFSDSPVINFTDGKPSKLHEIVERLYTLVGRSPEYTLKYERLVDIKVRNPTIFNNTHSLDDALKEMVENVG